MTTLFFRCFLTAFIAAAFLLSSAPPIAAQMGPGQRGPGQMGPGMMGQPPARAQGQPSTVPMPQMADVIKQLTDRLSSGKPLDADKANQLHRLADQLRAVAAQMGEGMGGMMGQGSQQMAEMNRILSQMAELLRDR